MNVTKPLARLPDNPLDRITLNAFDRQRAEAGLRRGEYIAELMLDGINAVRKLFGNTKPRAGVPRNLSHTG